MVAVVNRKGQQVAQDVDPCAVHIGCFRQLLSVLALGQTQGQVFEKTDVKIMFIWPETHCFSLLLISTNQQQRWQVQSLLAPPIEPQ